ncbi:MAG TPA: SgcJ/EcaC family oxidoreductase [Ramlibacter sp.]|nr:SgcJ/EcaC family oxidoreductase [Ramlibacter sp.]
MRQPAVAPTPDASSTRSNATSDILAAVGAAWTAAATPWDPEALAALYTQDAMFLGGRPGHSVGREQIHAYFASYRGVILQGKLELVDQHVRELAPDCLLAQGYGDFSFVLAGDVQTRSLLRTTLVLARQGDWKILQHHFSASPSTPPLGDS